MRFVCTSRDKSFMSSGTRPIFALVFLLGFACSTTGLAQDTIDARTAAAQRYVAVTDFESMIGGTINELAQQVPTSRRAEFRRYMTKVLDVDWYKDLAIKSMVQIFTTKELDKLADFYGSVEGKGILKKFPKYTATVISAIQQRIVEASKGFE